MVESIVSVTYQRICEILFKKIKDLNSEYIVILGKEEMMDLMFDQRATAKTINKQTRYEVVLNNKTYSIVHDPAIQSMLLVCKVV
jgi:ribosomal protein L13